ncbi:MAG TPA: hypothetical protein VFM93_04370 [Candidatus Limnocylindria bacterium]|nr:hypothetical protein [Candidatus Limnocylindria bacterium]
MEGAIDPLLARARAAARMRALVGVDIPERRAIDGARAELGAALRRARVRRASVPPAAAPQAGPIRRGLPWRRAAVSLLPLVALLAFALVPPARAEDPAGGGMPATAAAVDPELSETGLSRGRSYQVVTFVVVESTPEPTEEPPAATSAPAVAQAPAGSSGSGGGSGGGSGTSVGAGGGTGAPSASATPPPTTVTPTPTRTPSATRRSGETALSGRVIDVFTGRGVPGVCVIVGTRACNERDTYTDANGRFTIFLPMNRLWDLNFGKSTYFTTYRQVRTGSRTTQSVGDVPLTPK